MQVRENPTPIAPLGLMCAVGKQYRQECVLRYVHTETINGTRLYQCMNVEHGQILAVHYPKTFITKCIFGDGSFVYISGNQVLNIEGGERARESDPDAWVYQ